METTTIGQILKTQEAVKFMYDMMKKKETPISQLADQYDPMMQKFFDGEYASIFMYVGAIQSFVNSGKYGPDKQHIAPMPTFENKAAYISTWGYVLNSASKIKQRRRNSSSMLQVSRENLIIQK
mgnify:CR=1 FL=1